MKELVRNCPQCGIEIKYKSYWGHWNANKKHSVCRKCFAINSGFLERFATKGKNTGKDNAFYGKAHTEDTKQKISNKNSGKIRTDEVKSKMSENSSGKNNPMYGKKVYDVWLDKYGIEEADRLLEEVKHKISVCTSGENNPMYGKPSPHGSGNGWSGWYKNWYFRSLRELAYVINYLDKNNLSWVTGESKNLKINYINWDGTKRTYTADFFVEGKWLIECKPIKLHKSTNVRLKVEAAEKFCKEKGYEYKLVDPKPLPNDEVVRLYNEGSIKFIPKYEELFKERYLNVV